jgi:hypothetical protein
MGAMIGKRKKERAALDRLADFLVDDILNASNEDVLAEFKELHGDPDHNAAEMRALFEKSVLVSNKKRLAAAKAGVVENSRSSKLSTATTINIQAARARLRTIINEPSLPLKITLAARKENELSDADILSILDDLRELGILTPDDSQDDEL